MNDAYSSAASGAPDKPETPDKAQEYADVARWMKKYNEARKFDEDARKQYAKDRRYARGDSGFEVDANIIGTFVDVSESFLYAKQPDVDVLPAKSCEPPSFETMQEAAELSVEESPQVVEAGRQAFAMAIATGSPREAALMAGTIAENIKEQELVQQEFERLRKQYSQRQRDAKAFAETLELVISQKWSAADLKRRGRKQVRSGLTVGLGILKASWQERTAPSPETAKAINDLQANIARAAMLRQDIEDEGQGQQLDADMAEYQRQLETLRSKPEQVVSRGFMVDVTAPENFVVTPGYAISDHMDAPWNIERIPMLKDDARAEFGLDKQTIGQATCYYARKPEMIKPASASQIGEIDANEADAYVTTSQDTGTGSGTDGGPEWVMVLEIWDRTSGTVLTGIEGVRCWVKPAWRPVATKRFYPFFLFCTSEVDGQRHPQSLVTRSIKLVDEYNRIGSAEAEHRRRVRPKTMVNAGALVDGEADKLAKGVTQEIIALKTTVPKADLRGLIVPVTYAAIDAALYDRTRIMNELERIWGTQEALTGGVTVDKTATEAEIQQGGFQARIGSRRDAIDSSYTDLAFYTAQLLRAYLTPEDVTAIAGPGAFWPEYEGPDDIEKFVTVEIRAGSSGKPNTSAERQAMATLLPVLQNGVTMIGQLRGSLPTDLADAHAKLLQLVIERSGDRIDLDGLLPKAPAANPMAAMMPGVPGVPGVGAPGLPGAPSEQPTDGAVPPVEDVVTP